MADLEVQKHSVHTLVFRSLKRTHDMFLSDQGNPPPLDDTSHNIKLKCKIQDEYGVVKLNMRQQASNKQQRGQQAVPVTSASSTTENNFLALTQTPWQDQSSSVTVTGTHPYPTGSGVSVSGGAQQSFPGAGAAESMQNSLAASRSEGAQTAASVSEIQQRAGNPERYTAAGSKALVVSVGNQQMLVPKKAPTMPKPQWHPPWKLYRVISGHLGWVRCIAIEPGNEWFATGSGDRVIKIWDLASGQLKLSLTGHISTVRGLVVSPRQPYLFSCGEDKQVKCWDLEYNKVIRHYHGHLSAVYALDLHPTIDVLASCGRDATARIWDMRTKACIHTMTGHTNTVADVRCQAAEPQIITGSHDCTIRLWDLAAGRSKVTLTHHKKSVRALGLHPAQYTMASASADSIKQWKFPDGNFMQNLPGHSAIINTLSVNQDGILVSGGDNGTMYFWDWKSGYNFQRMQTTVQPGSIDSEAGIFASTFDKSGTRLLTCEADKTIKIYKEDESATEESHPIHWKPEIMRKKRY